MGAPSRHWLTVTAISPNRPVLDDLGRFLNTRVWFHRAATAREALTAGLDSDAVVLFEEGFSTATLKQLTGRLLANRSVMLLILVGEGQVLSEIAALNPSRRVLLLPPPLSPSTLLAIVRSAIPAPSAPRFSVS